MAPPPTPLPIDDQTASCFARIADEELRAGRKLRRHDVWIAATALRHGAAVVTQDADFSSFASVEGHPGLNTSPNPPESDLLISSGVAEPAEIRQFTGNFT
jgi:PIN domain